MSRDGSASQSGSSNSSSSQLSIFQDNLPELALYGSPAPTFIRTGTVVRRANTLPFRKDRIESTSSTEDDETLPVGKYRREPQYRHSLASISERKTYRNSFPNETGKTLHRTLSAMETSSDNTDYVSRSTTTTEHRISDRNLMSPSSSSYLSWIESVNSEYFGSAVSNVPAQDVDNKVGEWNNFWLNYSNARLHHLSTEQTFSSDGGDRTAEETSEDRKSQGSSQRDITEKNSVESIMLTVDEITEAIQCSQRVTDILNAAMKRTEMDDSSSESFYSQPTASKNPYDKDDTNNIKLRERSVSCVVDPQSLQRQKQALKNTPQSSSTSCINAILNTSVADILKKVITKRREAVRSENESRSATRSSFSEWSAR